MRGTAAFIGGLAALSMGCTSASNPRVMEPTPLSVRSIAEQSAPPKSEAAKTAATTVAVVGGVAAASAIGFTIAGAVTESSIRDGGFETGKDIEDAGHRGQTFNEIAFVSAGLAVAATGALLGLYFYAWRPATSKASRTESSTSSPTTMTIAPRGRGLELRW